MTDHEQSDRPASAETDKISPSRVPILLWLVLFAAVPLVLQTIGWPRYPLAGSIIGESMDWLSIGAALTQTIILAFGRYALLGLILGGLARRSLRAALVTISVAAGAVLALESADAILLSQSPQLVSFVLGWIGLGIGLAIRMPWGTGRLGNAVAWLVLIGVFVGPLIALGVYGAASMSDSASEISMPKVTSAEKRRIVTRIRKQREIDPDTPDLSTISFSWHDVRVLAAWGCEVVAPKASATVTPTDRGAKGVIVLPLPGDRYATAHGHLGIEGDEHGVRLRWHELRFGQLAVPNWIASLSTPIALRLARQDAIGRHVLRALRDLRMDDRGVAMTYDKVVMPDEYLGHATGALDDPALVESTKHYVGFVADLAESLPAGDQRFVAIVSSVFGEAHRRSDSSNATTENKAAILALAVTLGHNEIARFIGPVLDESQRQRLASAPVTKVQRRRDWVRHFTLSAGLSVLSSEGVSDAIGLLKEELDAGAGGSGFSFTDLAADRAGTRFGIVATRNEDDAARIQNLLKPGFDSVILIPPIGDLPEGLRDAQFKSRFQEVGSPAYQTMMDEVERRLDAAPGLN